MKKTVIVTDTLIKQYKSQLVLENKNCKWILKYILYFYELGLFLYSPFFIILQIKYFPIQHYWESSVAHKHTNPALHNLTFNTATDY